LTCIFKSIYKNSYLEQRMKSQPKENYDPPHMVKADMIARVTRPIIGGIVRETINEIADNLVHFSKALMVFNSILAPRAIKSMFSGIFLEVLCELIYEGMLEEIMPQELAVLLERDVEHENERIENEQKDKIFSEYIDSIILESCLAKISRDYEVEEALILKRESQAKEKRDILAEKKLELKKDIDTVKDELRVKTKSDKSRDIRAQLQQIPDEKMEPGSVGPKSVAGTEPNINGPKSIKDLKVGSQISLQEAVKEKMAMMPKVGGKPEPKNQLESVLMNLHS